MDTRRFTRGLLKFLVPVGLTVLVSLSASGQTTANCDPSATVPTQVASTGLAEAVGDIVLTCTGGSSGSTLLGSLYITLNTNVTNSLDKSGNPLGITFTGTGGAVATANAAIQVAANTLLVGGINYVVPFPNTFPVVITISGVRAAAASLQNGQATQVTASFTGAGISIPSNPITLAVATPWATSSSLNNGISCAGAPLPATLDFPGFLAVGGASSAVRVTESIPGGFAPKAASATNGTRIVVNLSGYGTGVRLFAPDALVGNSGVQATSGGEFGTGIASGAYIPGSGQLLLSRVAGAKADGSGGTLVTAIPAAATTFTAISEITVTNGSAFAVYEVLDANPSVSESFQAPVFIVTPPNNCANSIQTSLAAVLAPISTVSIATATDPVPRFIPVPLASDCQLIGDCNGNYFPILTVNTAPINLTGASQGLVQRSLLAVSNSGGTQLSLSVSITYQSVAGWLTVTPQSNNGQLALVVAADPSLLQAGIFNATVTLNAGVGGSATIPVTFTVGTSGPAIQAIVSSATFQSGKAAPGSYVSIYGGTLAGAKVTVTFNGLNATVIPVPTPYNATQINTIVPASLSGQNSATVVATIDGRQTNSVTLGLTPNVPAVFTPGILNSDSTVNSAANPAARGSFVQIYLTGLSNPLSGPATVTMGTQQGIIPIYAGAPYTGGGFPATLAGLDQVNVTIPQTLSFTGNSTPTSVCVLQVLPPALCSNTVTIYVK